MDRPKPTTPNQSPVQPVSTVDHLTLNLSLTSSSTTGAFDCHLSC